jgi:hypothetical protein
LKKASILCSSSVGNSSTFELERVLVVISLRWVEITRSFQAIYIVAKTLDRLNDSPKAIAQLLVTWEL